MSSSKSSYYAKIIKTCAIHNIDFKEHKKNPALLFEKDPKFRQYVYGHFQPNVPCTWYNRKFTFADHIPRSMYSKIQRENLDWYNALTEYSTILDENEDDLFSNLDVNESTDNEEPPSKKEKLEKGASTETFTKNTSADTSSSASSVPTQSTATAGIKRTNTEEVGSAAKKVAVGGTTNIATTINTKQISDVQSNPTGKGEVDQNAAQQQIQTNSGNAPNQRGTVTGEAGNLKIQKPLFKFGISKVNTTLLNEMSSNTENNRVFIFLTDDKELANDLIELMDDTYDNTKIYVNNVSDKDKSMLECLNGNRYIIGWKLSFNIGYPCLSERLGPKYNSLITFTKNIEEDDLEKIQKIMLQSALIRFKNNTQLLTLAEAAHRAQENQKRFRAKNDYKNDPDYKRPRFE